MAIRAPSPALSAQITARTVDFGASDAPLTPAQAAACNGCVQIPWALSATGVGFNIPGVKKLNLTGKILAGIYFGKITTWNDAKIKKANPGTKLPGTTITPVFRSDGSGDTYAFTNYLSKVSKAWKNEVGYATSVGFGHGVGAKGTAMPRYRGRHAKPRIGVDVSRAEKPLHQLVGNVIILGQQLP